MMSSFWSIHIPIRLSLSTSHFGRVYAHGQGCRTRLWPRTCRGMYGTHKSMWQSFKKSVLCLLRNQCFQERPGAPSRTHANAGFSSICRRCNQAHHPMGFRAIGGRFGKPSKHTLTALSVRQALDRSPQTSHGDSSHRGGRQAASF